MDEEPIRIPITDVLDLHSVPDRDVKAGGWGATAVVLSAMD
jgi:hypothetical protein